MPSYVCTVCELPVPAGLAFVRTVLFVPVAWCGPCWAGRVRIPAQRTAADEKVEA